MRAAVRTVLSPLAAIFNNKRPAPRHHRAKAGAKVDRVSIRALAQRQRRRVEVLDRDTPAGTTRLFTLRILTFQESK
jgi:hypothetical protein